MTTNPIELRPTGPAPITPPELSIEEIAAWLEEIDPILAAVRSDPRPLSAGAQRWVLGQVAVLTQVAHWLDDNTDDLEDPDQPALDALWIGVRVGTVAESMQAILSARVAA